MLIAANMSQEVYDYFKDYDLSDVVNTILSQYGVMLYLPPTSGKRDKECMIEVTDQAYLSVYNVFGARSRKVSLGRLLEWAYNIDVLNEIEIKPTTKTDDKGLYRALSKAYRAMLEVRVYKDTDATQTLCQIIYDMMKEAK